MNNEEFNENRWVFVSHSTKDFDRVRLVRNALEEKGFRPILFYLKSLTDKNEINDLLKREIDARKRFILCDSPNARQSEFVRSEVDYIRSQNRMYETIDLSFIDFGGLDEQESVLRLIKPFDVRTKVFVSYSRNDKDIADAVVKGLEKEGFSCFVDWRDLSVGDSFAARISEEIYSALDNGYFLYIISSNTISSNWSRREAHMAMSINMERMFPVIIDDLPNSDLPGSIMAFRNCLNVSHWKTLEEKAQAIVDGLIAYDLKKQKESSDGK